MPEEEASVPTGNGASQKNEKGHHNSKKLLYLFRFKYRKKSSSKSDKKTLTNSASVTPVLTTTASTNPEERRDKLDRDMKSNWEELPTTLRRRKEKLSAAVLAEFHSDDTTTPGVEPEEVVVYDSSIEKIEEGPVTQIVVAEINDHYAELCFNKSPKLSKKYVPEDSLSNNVSISDDESPTISKNKVSEDRLSSSTSNSDHERSDSPCLDQDNDSLECVEINSNLKVEDSNEERNSKEDGIGVTLSLEKCGASYAQEQVAHYGKSHKRSASCTHQDVCNNKIYEVLAPVEQENKSVKDFSLMELKKLKDDLQEVLQSTPNVHDESCQSDYFVAAVNCEDPPETSNDQNCLDTPSKSDETNKSSLIAEETLQSSIRKDTTLETSRDPTPLKMEERHVIRLLSRAVSEDSLIMSSGSEEQSSSNSASEDEDQHSHHDSGTDINNPSLSSSSCSEEAPEIAPPPAESRQGSDDSGVDDKVSCWKSCTSSSSSGTKTSVEESPLSQQVEEDNSSTYVSFANLHGSDHSLYEEVGNLHIPRVGYQAGKLEKMKVEVEKLAAPTAEEDAMSYYDAVALDRKSPDANKSKMYASLKNVRSLGGANGYHKSNFATAETKNYYVYNSGIKSEGNDVISEGETNKYIIVEQRECIESETKSLTKTISLKKELLDAGTVVTKLCDGVEQSDTDKGAVAKRYSATTWDEEEGGGGARRQDACGRWKKQETPIHRRNPRMMATILEEGDGGGGGDDRTCTKLSVREILKKFEELGGRMCPQGGEGEEKSATLREIQETLRCLEEKVRHYEASRENSPDQLQQKPAVPRASALESFQQGVVTKSTPHLDNWTGGRVQLPPLAHSLPLILQPHTGVAGGAESPGQHDGKHSLLQFAMLHFRQSPEKFEMLKAADGSISGSLKVIESKGKKNKDKKKGNKENDWTWKEQVSLVKFSPLPIEQSLLRLESNELNDLAIECFLAVMRYMGDIPMVAEVTEVKCVYTILMHCHKHESLRDEVYCQLMKQTTNNKSTKPDSCQRGWRLFSIVAAYFVCSDILKPYLFKYLETAAYDKRRAYHGTATVCLQNLRKTFKYGGRKNVPSVEEITAISAGRNSKRQIYRLPGGTERVINTKSTTVVQDVIEEMCTVINVQSGHEMEEFSLYCIVEGDTFTMPLAREEYILDVTTELHKNQQVFYLIFCRSVWHFPLRLDSPLYIEVVFNQIAPDYLEGLLLVMPGEQLEQDAIYDIAKIAALLHRAADMTHLPTMKETKFLLPKPALTVRDVKPAQWVNMVQSNWHDVETLQTIQAKAQVLDILCKWPLFGSSFFAVKRVSDPKERSDHILALNRHGVHFIDLVTHETLIHYTFSEVISTRKVKSEDGTLFLDMKCGNLMQQRITRLQTDQAHEISRLIRQYITMEQRLRS